MTELKNGEMIASFGSQGKATIYFTQTLRVPEDGKRYPLPAGLANIPLEPTAGLNLGGMEKRHGAVAPLHQSEAIYIGLRATDRPVFIRVFQGGVNLATGEVATGPGAPVNTLRENGKQDGYITQPYGAPGGSQPWIDGIKKAGEDTVKQLVAAPLGKGLTIEEQRKDKTTDLQGGLQFEIIPMKEEYFLKHVKPIMDAAPPPMRTRGLTRSAAPTEMGLGAGGNIIQQLVKSDYPAEAWDMKKAQSVSLGLVSAEQWKSVTGKEPQHKPLTKEQYGSYGIPWFNYYSGQSADNGTTALDKIKTLGEKAKEQGLPVDDSSIKIDPKKVKDLSPKKDSALPSWGSPPQDVSPADPLATPSKTRCGGGIGSQTRGGCGKH